MKGKYVDTKFEKPLVVRQPNVFKFQKPSVLEKPSPFSNSPFSKSKFSPMTNVNHNLSNPVTPQILHQNGKQTVRNMNVIKPGMYRLDTRPTQTRTPQFPQTSRNTNPRVSTSIGVIHTTSVSRPQFRSTHMKEKIVQIILFIVEFGCTKHMTGNLKLLCNFVDKYLGTRVYYVEGLNYDLFSVGQFCDADLEVAFRKSTCFVRDHQENDLLTGKVKRSSFKTKTVPSSKRWLNLHHMDLCGPMRIESINGKKYILVIVDDYSRYTWTYFLRSKDETPEVLFLLSSFTIYFMPTIPKNNTLTGSVPGRIEFRGSDKSKITRKQSKASKHGHENQKSTKPKPKEAKPQPKP
ncbi:retrovirus-related pol polyprotein from transposon TNT 1-94 [Tanacetum coccineum]